VPDEKDFCTLLSELIIDERKAPKDYQLLLQLLDEEKDLLLVEIPVEAHSVTIQLIRDVILKEISEQEKTHEPKLELVRRKLCEVKE